MSFKVVIPEGKDSVTVVGLHQWDYGLVLEIESADLGSEIVEVHFACTNMKEAVVRPCTFANGVGTVTIPDVCLEQTEPLTAWIYQIKGTQGHTLKTINLPITARTRPSIARDIPQEVTNKYTELITEINEAVDALEKGNVTVENANSATKANYATSAGNAESASYATSAGNASTASKAAIAEKAFVAFDVDANTTGEFHKWCLHESRYSLSTHLTDPATETGMPWVEGPCYIYAVLKSGDSTLAYDVSFGIIRYDPSAEKAVCASAVGLGEHFLLWITDNQQIYVAVEANGEEIPFPYSGCTLELRILNNVHIEE